ncbi:MAG: EamA family transporter [Eubacterium sp.]|nr:EamA family transporter [Eubacterium sp.]
MRESFEKNKKGILFMIVAAVFACVGQLLWKLSVTNGMLYLLLGFGLYGLGALLMLIAYRYGSVSVLQPMLSTNYVLSAVLGFFVLKEAITPLKVAGIVIITSGVVLIGGGDTQ